MAAKAFKPNTVIPARVRSSSRVPAASMERKEINSAKKEPNYRGIKAMPYVIGNETFEKLGTIGTSTNLLIYLTTVFNFKSITATNLVNIFNGTCNFGTLLGAFLSDTYLGRYKTLGIASVSSFLGMVVLTLTAVFPSLRPPPCGLSNNVACISPSAGQLTFLFTAFVFLVIGASGIRPCNLAFGADQFNPNTEEGKRGTSSFFNWYYLTFTFAMMLSLTVIVYVQSDVSWAIGLGIPAFLMFLSCLLFFLGTKIYVIVLPEGSPLTSMVQTLVVAFKKRKLVLPEEPETSLFRHFSPDSINTKLHYTRQLRWLNKAAIVTPEDKIADDGSAVEPWNLRSLQQVEEIKCVLRLIPIWVACVVYNLILAQTQTYFVFQAVQSDRRFGRIKIPAATYSIFTMISLTIWIPIYDRLLVPFLRRFTGKKEGITFLQRIGVGLVLGIVTMVIAGAVETHRRTLALTQPTLGEVPHKGAISSMSGSWLIPPLAVAGISEAFAIIGEMELFYNQFPENMRSFGGSLAFCGFAFGSYLNTVLISAVHSATAVGRRSNWLAEDLNQAKLDYFYYLVGGLQVVNLGYFMVCASKYVYKRRADDSGDVSLEKIQSGV